ncbi:MAG: YciI family protein [Gammaproteobacteria bacterium]
MRFMILVRADSNTEAGRFPEESVKQKLFADMARYHEALKKAGALLDGAGLKPSAAGWRVKHSAGRQSVIDGPFAETHELIAGYTLIEVKSREEALEWSRRYPCPAGEGGAAVIEVRPLYELDDFGPIEAIERFREMERQ